MRSTLVLLFFGALLCPPPSWALSAGAVIFERTDSTGTSASVVHVEKGTSGWQTTKVGSFPVAAVPSAYCFCPDASLSKGYVFRSLGGGVPEVTVLSVDHGTIPRMLRTTHGHHYSALAPFSYVEAIGWEELQGRVWLVGLNDEQFITPRDFLGVPLQDVSIARIASDRMLILGYQGAAPPPPGLPIEYTLFEVKLEPDAKATIVSQTPAPKKIPGVPSGFSSAGAFYVASENPGKFRVRHAPLPGATDRDPHLLGIVVSSAHQLAPMAQVINTLGATTSLLLQAADAFIEVPFGMGWAHHVVDANLFSAATLGRTTALTGARGVPTHRALAVTAPSEPFNSLRYQFGVGGGNAARKAPPALDLVRVKLEALWQDVFGVAVPTTIQAAQLIVLLENNAIKSEWLDKVLSKVDAGEVAKNVHIEKRGYPWVLVGQGGTVPSATLLTLLAAVPGCAGLLGP